MRLSLLILLMASLMTAGCVLTPGQVDRVRFARDAEPVLARTQAGVVRGVEGDGARAFLGVPYAAPPVGENRWRAPAPAKAWSGVRDATRLGRGCIQALSPKAVLGGGGGVVAGSEDCLYANIYAPAGEPERVRPVMVFLHGGAFTLGSGGQYDASRLAQNQGRVVVTFNYRLGALGWLALDDLAAPGDAGGDFGLMDMIALLRWVQTDIAAFGGDPGQVTVFGESAGGWGLCHLLASPEAKGLFQSAIIQSAGCFERSTQTPVDQAAADGRRFAEALGCADADCLRALPAWRVARVASPRRGINGPGSWGPVYGGPRTPMNIEAAYAAGQIADVPVIVGSNADEARLFTVAVRNRERFEREMRWSYGADAEAVLELYPVIDGDYRASMAASLTDALFACPAYRMRLALSPHVPVRGYEFADSDAPVRIPRWATGDMGAFHASELAAVFGASWALQDAGGFSQEQAALSDRMRRAWAGDLSDWPAIQGGDAPIRIFSPEGDRLDDSFARRHNCAFWADVVLGGETPRLQAD